ncbi:hypothetical protein V8G54_022817 [Vigna mungo]|uniref:Integrase catalytic domain-containing protein n=1 Tax=Vigna mungo TaxID=3915 RepID=A0AAQ3RS00_VIGMU
MREQETVEGYIGRIQVVVNAMSACDKIVKDKKIVHKILRTLTPQYDHIVVAILESKDLGKLKVEELQISLEIHEQRLLERKAEEQDAIQNTSQALQAKTYKNRGTGRGREMEVDSVHNKTEMLKATNKGVAEVEENPEAEAAERILTRGTYSVLRCWHNDNAKKEENDEANLAKEELVSDSDHIALMSMVSDKRSDGKWITTRDESLQRVTSIDKGRCGKRTAQTEQVSSNEELKHAKKEEEMSWYLDSACSNHMTGNRSWLIDLDTSVKSSVCFVDDSVIRAEGSGKVLITRKDGKPVYMHNVLYVPTMRSNLLSLGQLLEKGYTMSLQKRNIEIDHQGAIARNRTFKVNLNAVEIQCLAAEGANEKEWLWHYRFGHLNFRSLCQLRDKNLVRGIPEFFVPSKVCEGCAAGKQTRSIFKRYTYKRAVQVLNVIHADVCGPFDVLSLGGNRYFLFFVDEFSRKLWIYLLKEKKEIYTCFVQFCCMAERQSGHQVKIIRTDGGGKFNSIDMSVYCADKGIKHEVTVPYTPQHNGLAERRNRMILDMVRCMIKGKGLPKFIWCEAVATAIYILNRCPTKALSDSTPEEMWSKTKPDVRHLKVFGSIYYKHIPSERRKKLDNRSEVLILVGYHPTGAYRMFDPVKHQVVIGRDIIIDEAATYKWKEDEVVPTQGSGNVITIWTGENRLEEIITEAVTVDGDTRRSQRTRFPSTRLNNYELFSDGDVTDSDDIVQCALFTGAELLTLEQAIEIKEWRDAMQEELTAIDHRREVGIQNQVQTRWNSGKTESKKPRIDFNDVYAPVARIETVRLVVAIANVKGWIIHQMDEEVFVNQPPGFTIKGQESKVYQLNKALYGLRQAPYGFKKCTVEYGIYIQFAEQVGTIVVCLYVDDLLITGSSTREIERFKTKMKNELEMTDLGRLGYFLGMEFVQTEDGMIMHQRKYILETLERFNLKNCNSMCTPVMANIKLSCHQEEAKVDATLYKQMVGTLRYICNSRPDISFGVGLISRFMHDPRQPHLYAVKHIFRYLKGTADHGLYFPRIVEDTNNVLEAWCDADWSGDQVDRKSTFGYLFKLMGASISWCSKKQAVVALSSCEAEYISAAEAVCQCAWVETILRELMIEHPKPTQLMVDNRSAISLSKNPISHGISKHIETKFHYLREHVSEGKLELVYCSTDEQIANVFTKPLRQSRFEKLRDLLGVKSLSECLETTEWSGATALGAAMDCFEPTTLVNNGG